MSLSFASVFVGLPTTGSVIGVNGTKAGDIVSQVVEFSPQPGTDRSNQFGSACPQDGTLIQLPGVGDFSTHVFIVSLLRP
jgi:hypothetical protein